MVLTLFLELERGGEVRYGNPSNVVFPRCNGPAGPRWPAVARDILFGDVAGAVNLQNLVKYGYEGLMLRFLFNICTGAGRQQILDLLRNKRVSLAGSIEGNLVIEPVGGPFRRPFVLVSSFKSKDEVAINEVVTPVLRFFLDLSVNVRVDGDRLRLVMYTVGIREPFGHRLEAAGLGQPKVQAESHEGVRHQLVCVYVVQSKDVSQHWIQWKSKTRDEVAGRR